VYSFGRAALLLLVEVQNHTVPVRERRRIRVNKVQTRFSLFYVILMFACFCSKNITAFIPHIQNV